MTVTSKVSKIPIPGVLKITLAYGFAGFASVIILYILTMLFWTNLMFNAAYFTGLAQTYILVLFIQFSTGFFAQIAIYKAYNPNLQEKNEDSLSGHNKFRNYGLLGGFFIGIFILLFPVATAPLMYHNNSIWIQTFTNLFSTFFPFVITGIIGGTAGSYSAGSLLKNGLLEIDNPDKKLQEIFLFLTLIALLIVILPSVLVFSAVS